MKRFILFGLLSAVLSAMSLPLYADTPAKNYVIGFYNLENLFDTFDDPAKYDEEFLPEGKNKWTDAKYQKKLHNMASVIGTMASENGAFHTILGVSEIENRLVLEDLVSQPEIARANYQIVHYDSPDARGVDVGLLYRPDQFTYLDSESIQAALLDCGALGAAMSGSGPTVFGLFNDPVKADRAAEVLGQMYRQTYLAAPVKKFGELE